MVTENSGLDGPTRAPSRGAAMLDWWSSELAAMLPASVRRAMGLEQDVLLLRLSDERLEVGLRESGRDRHIDSIAWRDRDQADATTALRGLLSGLHGEAVRVVLTLDPALALRRTFQVPRAAEAEITGVLAFEIERHTPFRESEIHFDHTIDRANSSDSTLAVDMVIVPRRLVDPLIRALSALDFGLDEMMVSAAPDQADGADARVPVEGTVARRRHGANGFRLWASLAMILAIAAATTPLIRITSLADDLAVAVQQAKAEAETTRALQAEADSLTRGMNVIARAKADASSPLTVLHALTDLLPDGTWVEQLSVVGDEVILEGRTDSSARLVGLLEASPLFDSVKYLAPVTRDAGAGVERFNFSLRLARS